MDFFINLYNFNDIGLLALRLAIGAIFWVHGTKKWSMWKAQPSAEMPAKMVYIMRLLSVAEPLGALAVISGFFTQLAALGLGIIMLGAIWMKITAWKISFAGDQKSGWEFDFTNLVICFYLFLTGAGVISLDRYFFGI